ncbi:MAG: PQQ-binding-like beta-propeller repeat protein [Planctomycetota bacterium]
MRRIPWLVIAVIAGLFSVMITAAMIANLSHLRSADPLRNGDLAALKAELAQHPKDEALKTKIREHDAAVRSRWFSSVAVGQRGAWLLLLGVALTVLAVKQGLRAQEAPFDPRPVPPPNPTRVVAMSRWGLAAGGIVLAIGLLLLGGQPTPESQSSGEVTVRSQPSPAELARNWPSFRGSASGLAAGAAPIAWDAVAGTGVLWKIEPPLPGLSSPVVWGDTVYVSGSDGKNQEISAYASATGDRRWSCRIPLPAGAVVEAYEATGHAAPTPVTDGQVVVGVFASGVLAAVSCDGRLLWSQSLGIPDNSYSLAASPVIWQDRVIMQLDQGAVEDGRSALLAFDLSNGRKLWRTARPVAASWASPLVTTLAGRAQVITCSDPWVISYDPAQGREWWRAKVLSGEVSSSPTVAGGCVIAVKPNAELVAIRPDGSGDVTASHIAWRGEDSVPDMSSPTGDATMLALFNGDMLCCDAVTGTKLWQHPGTNAVIASPIIADGRLYVIDETGSTTIFAWDRSLKVLGTAHFGEKISSTPAVVDGRIYVRGDKHLFCIGSAP